MRVNKKSVSRFLSGVMTIGIVAGVLVAPATAHADDIDGFLNLPLTNIDSSAGPGGVHPALPTDTATLLQLLDTARGTGAAPESYAALLYQYWLARASDAAGIDLANWDPRAGVSANRVNLAKSYDFYNRLQLSHKELQWAGMGGMSGPDFGGALLDFEMIAGLYDLSRLQPVAQAVVETVTHAAGAEALDQLPTGLRALANSGGDITPADLREIIAQILVMQKHIFSDLMPMHEAYISAGLPALEEMSRAGLFPEPIMAAWRDVASGDPSRIARGNATLLRREQSDVIGPQWDALRAYKGSMGEALTYASTVVAAVTVAGVRPPRSHKPIVVSRILPDGRTVTVTTPLPSWNWSVYDERWDYITTQLLPTYRRMAETNWPALEAVLTIPSDQQLETHRPLPNLPDTLQSALDNTKVVVS